MKSLGKGLALLGLIFVMNACASKSEVVTEGAGSQSPGTIPGEKISGDGAVGAGMGPGGPSANVSW